LAGNNQLKKVAGFQSVFLQVWVTCAIDARLEQIWFWVCFSLTQIVYVQLISQKKKALDKLGDACGVYDSMSRDRDNEVSEKKRMFFWCCFFRFLQSGLAEE
jgi:hypothetical protein